MYASLFICPPSPASPSTRRIIRVAVLAALSTLWLPTAPAPNAHAAVVFGLPGNGNLTGGFRWNASELSFSTSQGTLERSLVGGLRYSISGGNYTVYRDQFNWSVVPTETEFRNAIADAFIPWTLTDPVSGLGTSLSFVEDLGTAVSPIIESNVRLGAEIDLFAGNIGSGTRGEAFFNARGIAGGVTLTSGTTGYGGAPIAGADITMNNNAAIWNLNSFQTILTHEIGHAIGLGDVEDFFNNGFIDNNYDPANPTSTLTDAWAQLVDPMNPGGSVDLSLFSVPNNSSGVDAPGVDILMESAIPGTFFANGAALQNDDFGARQFLYPELSAMDFAAADFNRDGLVNLLDLDILGANWQGTGTPTTGDATGDGLVNLLDLDELGQQWQGSAAFNAALAAAAASNHGLPIPEPGMAGMVVAMGLIGSRKPGRIRTPD